MSDRSVLVTIGVAWGLALALHVTCGWAWTVLAGGVVGGWRPLWGWFWGAAGGVLGWASLTLYTALTTPSSLRILVDTLGALGGNIPGALLVGASVVLGGTLGGLGGGLGMIARRIVREATGTKN